MVVRTPLGQRPHPRGPASPSKKPTATRAPPDLPGPPLANGPPTFKPGQGGTDAGLKAAGGGFSSTFRERPPSLEHPKVSGLAGRLPSPGTRAGEPCRPHPGCLLPRCPAAEAAAQGWGPACASLDVAEPTWTAREQRRGGPLSHTPPECRTTIGPCMTLLLQWRRCHRGASLPPASVTLPPLPPSPARNQHQRPSGRPRADWPRTLFGGRECLGAKRKGNVSPSRADPQLPFTCRATGI